MSDLPIEMDPGLLNTDELPIVDTKLSTNSGDVLNTNTYSIKKGAALGMMDLALLTANANQLRFLMVYNDTSKTYYVSFVMLIISLVMQVGVGITLIIKQDMKSKGKRENLSLVNNIIICGIFLITVINVIAAAFTVIDPSHK